jgi:hypothetical protein
MHAGLTIKFEDDQSYEQKRKQDNRNEGYFMRRVEAGAEASPNTLYQLGPRLSTPFS